MYKVLVVQTAICKIDIDVKREYIKGDMKDNKHSALWDFCDTLSFI